jgi:aminoglycoside N3'-acetyltransferase
VASWGRARWARPLTLRLLWGKQTDYLLASQPWDYAFGADSALERLLLLDGKIVLLGSDHDAVTFLHYAEHIVEFQESESRAIRYPSWRSLTITRIAPVYFSLVAGS